MAGTHSGLAWLLCVVVIVTQVAACERPAPQGGSHGNGGPGGDGGGAGEASPLPDAAREAGVPQDADSVYHLDGGAAADACPPGMTTSCPSPVAQGCVTSEVCGNGLDDNCNGEIDEICSCSPGAVQPCFLGPPGRSTTGACTMGTQTCVGEEFGAWGPCQNGIWPSVEVCDGLDNDCNGCDDDGLCCDAQINCPRSADVPAAHPFQPYRFDGTQWYSGQATSWSWTVEGGHCDELLGNQFTITGADTATPELMFTLSGDYAVTLEVVGPTGTHVCNFVLHVAGPGLRVELCWEGTGSRDVDLHLLRHDLNADWCDTRNDCYYMNCAGADYDVNWGYPRSPLTHCQNGPEGDDWADLGYCANPRLDIDNIYTEGIPENINLDNPNDGDQFRTMVHYYNGSGEAYPLVNIYCDGHRVATYGQAPNRVTGFTDSEHGCQGHTWRVADIQTHLSGGETSCTVTALHHRNETSGYLIRRNNNQFD